MKYSLPGREIIEDTIELMVKTHRFDRMVLIPTCDKIVPGHLMAAGRLYIPAIVVTGGPIALVKYGDMIEINIPERALNLKISEEELKQRKAAFVPPKTGIKGYLARYQRAVHPTNTGGIVD